MNNKNNDYNELTKNGLTRTLIVISVVIFIFFTLFSFHCRRPFLSTDLPIDIPTWGAYGDFIGGLVGTILAFVSILILRKTLLQQQKESYDNQNVLTLDRFNSLFFELVRLYNQHLDSLKESDYNESEKSLTAISGREFLEKKKNDFQKEFEPVLQDRWNLESAKEMYDDKFFTEYRTVFVCFSTLYRIYDLIDKSEIDEKDKREYSKIIRSQLSPQELFFMRYNAESFYGTNFRDYINRYNILKHLPSFELMEFKKWSKDLDQNEIESVNRLFFMVKKRIRNFHKSKQENFEECSVLNDMIKIGRSIDSLYVKINQKNIKNFAGLKKLEMNEVVNLFQRFLKEMYIYSSFQMVNKKDELKVTSWQDKDNADYMVCKIKVNNEQRLFLYDSEKNLYA